MKWMVLVLTALVVSCSSRPTDWDLARRECLDVAIPVTKASGSMACPSWHHRAKLMWVTEAVLLCECKKPLKAPPLVSNQPMGLDPDIWINK